MRFLLVISVSNSSPRSYSVDHTSLNTLAAVTSGPSACSTRLTSARPTVATALYENRLHPLSAALPYASPCPCFPSGCSDAHSPSSCSLTGTRVRVSTVERADHRSTMASPYWLIPSRISVSGAATAGLGLVDATSHPICARLCQKIAPASSTLSKKSSSEYSALPHPPSAEW
jgi:hypothetical protein